MSTRRHKPQGLPYHNVLVALLLLPIAAICVLAGSRLVVSGLASYQTLAFLEDWQSRNIPPDSRAWNVAHQAAERAVNWYPGTSGKHWQRLGLVWQWRDWQADHGNADAQHSREQALVALRRATELRPTWPVYWSNLAYAKWQLQQFDDEYLGALQQALRYGATRIEVQRRLAQLDLMAAMQQTRQQQQTLAGSIPFVAGWGRKDARMLQDLAEQRGQLAWLCGRLQGATYDGLAACQQATATFME